MHHLAKITFGKAENRPYHGECACGTAGDFVSNQDAREYLAMHLTRLQGINSAGFEDQTVAPLEVPKEEPAEVAEEEKPKEPEVEVKDEGKSADDIT